MLIGQSLQIMTAKRLIREIAKSTENALLIGDVGTGKKQIAQEIQQRSSQKNKPLITINCTAVGDTITESDLFGEKSEGPRGVERKIGLLEQAQKGILYMENVDELKAEYQQKFFNILKEKKYPKAGEKGFIDVDFRVIAATTDEEINKNEDFRSDLLELLNVYVIQIPKLNKRKQDIPHLFSHFLEVYSEEFEREIPPVPAELFESLIEYDWPGNIQELKNAVRNLLVMSPDGQLAMEFLPFEIRKHPFEFLEGKDLPGAVSEVERYLIRKTLRRFAGNQTKAAKALSVSEAALRYKMKKFGLTRKAF